MKKHRYQIKGSRGSAGAFCHLPSPCFSMPPCGSQSFCPPCPPCPPSPTPDFPRTVCTAAFESLSNQPLATPSTPVTIPNAFNPNDGPGPYTLLSAAFFDLQLPLEGLQFSPLGGNLYTLSAQIRPMILVTYLDVNSLQRAKLIPAPLALSGTVTAAQDPGTVDWWAFLDSGSITSPVLAGNSLTFTAQANLQVIALPPAPSNYAVLQDYTCAQVPPVNALCRSLFLLDSYCTISTAVPGNAQTVIPFVPLGTAPFSNPSAQPTGGDPYLLRATALPSDVTILDLAFPVTLTYTDGTGQTQSQATFLFMTIQLLGVADVPSARILADLEIFNLSLPGGTITTNSIIPFFFSLSGTIAVVEREPRQVLTTDAVECGPILASLCTGIFLPPTAEITT